MKVHISPHVDQVDQHGGIGRVIAAQYRYLPELGIELVGPDEADVVAAHISRHSYGLDRADVLHCHGLYWTGDHGSGQYSPMHDGINSEIVETARGAYAITVPSAWVAMPFMRDMRIVPEIIGHGLDIDSIPEPVNHDGYVLWNKNRAGDVCDPGPAVALAERGAEVVTTFVRRGTAVSENLRIIGLQTHERMMEIVARAEIYLATTKETFGIGTLEALAAGVPVLGYAHGGTKDIVQHQVTGYLARPGDIDDLMTGYQWIREHRTEMVSACRSAAMRYDWRVIMRRYADLYQRVAEQRAERNDGVSIVITNYNYGRYVEHAIRSAAVQTRRPEEIIVIDDGSTDDSKDIISRLGGEIPLIFRAQTNQGVASARNAGIALATQRHVVCLDADDELDPRFIGALLPALQKDRGLGIAYSGLKLLWEDGRETLANFPPAFDWDTQSKTGNPPPTCIPSGAMFRRDMWLRAGPYQQVWAPGEDTEFWTRGLSVGFRAEKVTEEPLFRYRLHADSASRMRQYRPIDVWHPWMRDRQYPMGAPADKVKVRSYSTPIVSVVIPVGPGHAQHLPAALDSLLGQTMREWEAIVVFDGPDSYQDWKDNGPVSAYPFVKMLSTEKVGGAGAARNAGLSVVSAPYVIWLDADDYLMPTAIERMLSTMVEHGGRARYIYSDWYAVRNGEYHHDQAPAYSQQGWFGRGLHAVTVLMETQDARGVGGFDEALPGWEDYDFFIKLAVSGVCGMRCPEPLLAYRQELGTRREISLVRRKEIAEILERRYAAYRDGGIAMGGCCGGNGKTIEEAKTLLGLLAPPPAYTSQEQAQLPQQERGIVQPDRVRMEFIGPEVGSISFRGPSGTAYRGGNNNMDRYANVLVGDVDHLVGTGRWKAIYRPQPTPQPAPIPQPMAPHPPLPAAPSHPEHGSSPLETETYSNQDYMSADDEEAAKAADEAVRAYTARRKAGVQ